MRALAPGLIVLGLVAASSRVAAQWGVTADIGVARFGGSARDTSGSRVGPYRPTTLRAHLDRDIGRARVGLAVLHAKTGLAAEGRGLAVVQYDLGSLWEIAPELSLRVVRVGQGNAVRVEAGPAVDLWDFDGEQRTRVGGQVNLALEWPVVHGLCGAVRVGGAWSASIFDAADVPAGAERRATRRFGVALGLRYQP